MGVAKEKEARLILAFRSWKKQRGPLSFLLDGSLLWRPKEGCGVQGRSCAYKCWILLKHSWPSLSVHFWWWRGQRVSWVLLTVDMVICLFCQQGGREGHRLSDREPLWVSVGYPAISNIIYNIVSTGKLFCLLHNWPTNEFGKETSFVKGVEYFTFIGNYI